jgi:predicted metalloenzyme YecM
MLIAKDKLKNNIVEYILYMWRIEDLLRAMNFDMEAIKSNLISIQSDDEQTSKRNRAVVR